MSDNFAETQKCLVTDDSFEQSGLNCVVLSIAVFLYNLHSNPSMIFSFLAMLYLGALLFQVSFDLKVILYITKVDSIQSGLAPLKELRHRSRIFKEMAKLFTFVSCNPFQSPPSSAIRVPFCFRITPLVFLFLSKSLYLGFPTL